MVTDLFEYANSPEKPRGALGSTKGPLAHRMRPATLAEFVGQERILASGKPLRAWIEKDQVPSLIFWGPPGCGKTTLAQIISQHTDAHFQMLSAVSAGVKDIKEITVKASDALKHEQKKTILFLDEIHRFNKSQQDALLPHVEDGTLILIGATTENPSFELNHALLSRARVIRFESLSWESIATALRRALADPVKGLGGLFCLSEDAVEWLARIAEGDARKALSSLETIALTVRSGDSLDSESALGVEQVRVMLQAASERQPISYDKKGEEHYNVISAFIKSIRDSDPDAGLYYLARMLEGGEDPIFIARRLVILASEDVGIADPMGLVVAIAAKDAAHLVGMPEARISLAQAVVYLARAPKSNASYLGIDAAIAEVRQSGALPVPFHLRNGVTGLMKAEGYGVGYRYVHSDPNARLEQSHLPKAIEGKKFFKPK